MSDTPLIWYVAYGSNLLTDRMLAYLVGCGDDRPQPRELLGHHSRRDREEEG